MNLTEWGFWYVCTLLSNLDMQNKIIFQILPEPPHARFSFSPVIPQSYSDTRWPPDTDTGKLLQVRHKKRKSLLLYVICSSAITTCPSSSTLRAGGSPETQEQQEWEAGSSQKTVFIPYIHTFWKELNHQLIEKSFSVFQIPLICNGKQKSSLFLQIIINKISGLCWLIWTEFNNAYQFTGKKILCKMQTGLGFCFQNLSVCGSC